MLYFPESNATNVTLGAITAISDDYTLSTLPAHFDITKAYPTKYLTIVPAGCNYHKVGRPWEPFHVIDLMDPPQNWIAQQGCFWEVSGPSAGSVGLGSKSPNGTELAANGVVSYPPDILILDPVWKNCGADANNWGFYDPPRGLTSVGAIAPPPTQGSEGLLFHIPTAGPSDPGNVPVLAQSISAQPEAHRTASTPASVTASETTEPQPIKTEASSDQPAHPHAPSG